MNTSSPSMPDPASDDAAADAVQANAYGYPAVRLRPKVEARAIRHGFPWVYADELVTDRRTQKLAPGALAVLEDAERRPLGLVTVNTKSKIIARMLDRDPAAVIDQAWFEARLSRALAMRARLFDAPFYRLVHAEADALPGIIIDRFGDVAVIQPNAAWAEAHLDALTAALQAVTGVGTVVKNGTGRSRGLEGMAEENAVLAGAVDGPIAVPMNGATYMADVTGGQKTGLFYDQRPNHAFAARLARGAAVLDVFTHVGGFALAALAAGATSALAVDASAPALALATRGAEASGVAERFATRQGDAFDVLEKLGSEGAKFDLVICDPPAFAPAKPALEAGLRAYERLARLAAPLVAPGGYLVLCSCSHAADLHAFRNASARGIGRGGRKGQLIYTGFAGPDHPMLPQLAESGYLKSLVFRLD
ncbi:RSP_2647 family RNA methyltransferase [Paragemmobacter straminiformis]|uniref:Class I SAM-dependent rRNA methyltransferase n=1 Tax=Paragemmobacter straminiformis TaxID=2045119 RepID=A0A842I668_9RHOB|nr:class I SAM-dependent rRNA methyltransferase [Gemmobacter straminiformis]MBC2835340.1 class I SAM-dependent rRNA methyltransferase [Gemmobacter straminiformis]